MEGVDGGLRPVDQGGRPLVRIDERPGGDAVARLLDDEEDALVAQAAADDEGVE